MSIASISSSQSYASFNMYASTGAGQATMPAAPTAGSNDAASTVSSVLGQSMQFTEQTSSLTVAFDSADSLLSGMDGSNGGDDMMKMIVALMVLAYILGDEEQQQNAMKGLSELLGMSGEQVSMTITASQSQMSMSAASGGQATALSHLSPPPAQGGLVDVMA